jgi:magnesium chelatase family protein
VSIARATGTLIFPSNFMFVAAMNPCPCGYHGDPVRECICSMSTITRYQKRISGPLLDRIDIHIEVPRVDYDKLTAERLGEPSQAIQTRVDACSLSRLARERQRERFAVGAVREPPLHGTPLSSNADMGPGEVRKFCQLDETGRGLVRAAMLAGAQRLAPAWLQMSARAFHRILKLARTIADLTGNERIEAPHLAEAIQYRPRRTI